MQQSRVWTCIIAFILACARCRYPSVSIIPHALRRPKNRTLWLVKLQLTKKNWSAQLKTSQNITQNGTHCVITDCYSISPLFTFNDCLAILRNCRLWYSGQSRQPSEYINYPDVNTDTKLMIFHTKNIVFHYLKNLNPNVEFCLYCFR